MKLRTRLFLWIGLVFASFFLIAMIWQNVFVKKSLLQAETTLQKELLDQAKKKIQNYEDYLGIVLADLLGKLNAHLYALFLQNETDPWLLMLQALEKAEEVDSIQYEDDKGSLGIFPQTKALSSAVLTPVDQDIFSVETPDKKQYWGLALPASIENGKRVLFIFRKEDLTSQNLPVDPAFQAVWERARKEISLYAPTSSPKTSVLPQDDPILKTLETASIASPLVMQEFIGKLKDSLSREELVFLITELVTKSLSLFEKDVLTSPIQGAVFFSEGEGAGDLLLKKEVLYSSPKKSFPYHGKGISPDVVTLDFPEKGEIYFGNLVQMSQGGLFLGIGLENLIQRLALVTNQRVFLVYKNKVFLAYDPQGAKVLSPPALPLNAMQENMGTVEIEGKKSYYLQFTPFSSGDLHFFAVQPLEKAFFLVDSLEKNTKSIIQSLSVHMRFIAGIALIAALFILHYLAKRITGPICELAKGAALVSEGHYEKLTLPKVEEKRRDEITSLVHSFSEMVQGLKDREKVRGVLNKVVSKEVASQILQGGVHLGGEERVVAVLFADIRGFTHMTEKMAPQEVIGLLNQCMTRISHVVDEKGGVIDKYVGDEAMALFGAPLPSENAALHAAETALEMMKSLRLWNEERKKQGLFPVEIGIGVHIGKVFAGNMGAENRLNYTVLGANVNLAARLCSAAGPGEILVSEAMVNVLPKSFAVKELPPMKLKGFSEEVKVFSLLF